MYCPYCGRAVPGYLCGRCPECWPVYHEAFMSNNFPAPFVRAGIMLDFGEWSEMKKKEDRLYAAGKTDEEVDAEINEWAQSRVDCVISARTAAQEAQAQHSTNLNRARNRRYQQP